MTRVRSSYMAKRFLPWGGVLLACILAGLAGADTAKEGKDEPAKKENSNALLKKHKENLKVTASTFFEGWAPERILDDNLETSWFTAGGDAVAKGTTPWIEVELPADEIVKRVTLHGNREPDWAKGFSILAGTIEFLDKDRKKIWSEEKNAAGDTHDFDFRPKAAMKGVRYIRFTSTKDEGDQNNFEDVALAEIQIE